VDYPLLCPSIFNVNYGTTSIVIVNIIRAMTKMEKGQKLNHPAKRSIIAVSPIRNQKDIKSIQKLLTDKPWDLLLFTMGLNNGLGAGDLPLPYH